MVKAKRLLEPVASPSRQPARERVCLSDQVQPARSPQEPPLHRAKPPARLHLLRDRVQLVELAAGHSSGSQF